MKKIPLTQGQFAMVNDEDYDMLNQFKWYALYQKHIDGYYAVRHIRKSNGKWTTEYMHRVILNCPTSKETDHKNHDGLDNRRCNLRIVTHGQNQYNRKSNRTGVSKYKGVSLHKQKYKNKVYEYWQSQIRINGKLTHLGYFETEIDAAIAYNKKAKELFGNYALLNRVDA